MAVKITSDSTCDLSPQLIAKYDIELFPLYITLNGKTGRDGVDFTSLDIFKSVAEGGSLAATAAVTPNDYESRFSSLSRQYDAVIHINISSEFSSCHQNARIAAENYDNVYVVDSRNLSTGHGHVVVEAALRAQSGMEAREIVRQLETDIIPKVDASFILDRLDYMAKGGRCSAVTALGANVLQLKPCIEVVDGKMRVGTKYRGSFEKCVHKYVKDRLSEAHGIRKERIFVTHSDCPQADIDAAVAEVEKNASFDEVLITRAGCTVASHCGPRTLGILYIRE